MDLQKILEFKTETFRNKLNLFFADLADAVPNQNC